jgi:hypothetical protein
MPADPSFRMTIQDVFPIRGRGTIAIGQIESGKLAVGDAIWIQRQSSAIRAVVIAIEAYRKQLQQAQKGDTVGVILRGIERADIQLGDVLAGWDEREKPLTTYRNEKHGFEINLGDEWSVYSGIVPLLPTILFTIENGWIPKTDIEFSTGLFEYLNIVVEIMNPEPPAQFLERFFSEYAQQMNFTDCVYGRIVVRQKEHVWARYQMRNNVWCKKFMIILNGVGYAITASCAGKAMFLQRERTWDDIAKSLRSISL